MATTATATKTHGLAAVQGLGHEGIFELVLDTTDANGELSCDLTSYFSYVFAVSVEAQDATDGYYIQIEKPAYNTALTSTNLKIGIYEAGADAAPLDALASTDVSGITGLTIRVIGKKAAVTSWA